jgi:hypothetical protein
MMYAPKPNWLTLYGLVAAGVGLLFAVDALVPAGGIRTMADLLIVIALTVSMLGWVGANRVGLVLDDRPGRALEPDRIVHASLGKTETDRFITRPAA